MPLCVARGVHLQGRVCAHMHCAVVMLRSGMVTLGDADRVLTVTSQEPQKWRTLQHASRSFSRGVGCHLLLLRWLTLWGLIY